MKQETEEIQAKIQEKLGINPIENDVVVLYQGETLPDQVSWRLVVDKLVLRIWDTCSIFLKKMWNYIDGFAAGPNAARFA